MGGDAGAALTARRLRAQMLAGEPASDPVDVAERLLAIQGQDARGVRLAIRSRSAGLTAAAVDRALSEERSLLITWLNRGTLHLVRSADYPWLHAVMTPRLSTGNARRLAQLGVSAAAADKAVGVIERSLARDGPLTRAALGERIASAGVRTDGQALVHLLMLACLRRITVRGPVLGGHHAYALVRDWLGEQPAVDRHRGLAELARRYLAGHGPANERDLARWSGLPLRDVRAGLGEIASELAQQDDGLLELSALASARDRSTVALPPPKLLGAFDPLLLGWVSRKPILNGHQRLITVNGLFRPFALIEGKAAAIWRLQSGSVKLEPLRELSAAELRALDADARDVIRYCAGG